jgi:hypothetical protein
LFYKGNCPFFISPFSFWFLDFYDFGRVRAGSGSSVIQIVSKMFWGRFDEASLLAGAESAKAHYSGTAVFGLVHETRTSSTCFHLTDREFKM